MERLRVSIDPDVCACTGYCVQVMPAMFELDEDGGPTVVLDPQPPLDLLGDACVRPRPCARRRPSAWRRLRRRRDAGRAPLARRDQPRPADRPGGERDALAALVPRRGRGIQVQGVHPGRRRPPGQRADHRVRGSGPGRPGPFRAAADRGGAVPQGHAALVRERRAGPGPGRGARRGRRGPGGPAAVPARRVLRPDLRVLGNRRR